MRASCSMRYLERHECWSLMYLVCIPIVGCLVGSVVFASIPSIVLRLGCSALCVSISCLISSYLLSSAAECMSLACALMIA